MSMRCDCLYTEKCTCHLESGPKKPFTAFNPAPNAQPATVARQEVLAAAIADRFAGAFERLAEPVKAAVCAVCGRKAVTDLKWPNHCACGNSIAAQPAPFAVGDRVEWSAVPNVDGMGFERSPRTGQVAAVGPSICLVWDGAEYHQVALLALRRPPAKRVVEKTQIEYAHPNGSLVWWPDDFDNQPDWLATGRTHIYEVDEG